MASPWDDLTEAHPERIAIAVRTILEQDAQLGALFEAVLRLADPTYTPERELPYAMVAVSGEQHTVLSSGINDAFVDLLILIVWEEDRDAVEDDEGTVARAVSRIEQLFMGTYRTLAVTGLYGGQALVDAPESFQTVAYDAADRGAQPRHDIGGDTLEPPIEPIDLVRFLTVQIRYRYAFDRASWSKVGFTP